MSAETIGPYRLVRVLGAGATATVYLAEHLPDGRQVALKVMPDQGATDNDQRRELRRRFLQEADIVQRLRHPDIVAPYAAGEGPGMLWLAMDLAPGCPLDRYLDAANLLPVPTALRVAARLARALGHAHRHGVVHRDIKPSNVLVDLGTDSVKLTDFGTARLLDSRRTGTEFVLGTPAYMAPEMLAGNPATASTDVYSLGVLLFELLTGRRPHQSASLGELLRQVAGEAAPDVCGLRPGLPRELSRLMGSVLAKRPQGRPANADQLAQALERVMLSTPPPSDPGVPAH